MKIKKYPPEDGFAKANFLLFMQSKKAGGLRVPQEKIFFFNLLFCGSIKEYVCCPEI